MCPMRATQWFMSLFGHPFKSLLMKLSLILQGLSQSRTHNSNTMFTIDVPSMKHMP